MSVNGVASKCAGICDFVWAESSTPIVTDILIVEDVVTLTGTGFDANSIDNNQVRMVGDEDEWPCQVTEANATQLTCEPYAQTPVGTYEFIVNIINRGFARINSTTTTITFNLDASSFSPTTGGTGGLSKITF